MKMTYTFPTDSAAWAFMRACEKAGISAGYPSLVSPPTVQVAGDGKVTGPLAESILAEAERHAKAVS